MSMVKVKSKHLETIRRVQSRLKFTYGAIVILSLMVFFSSMQLSSISKEVKELKSEYDELNNKLIVAKQTKSMYLDLIDEANEAIVTLQQENKEMSKVLRWEETEKELTFYAPLDPNAVEGMCYSGDPTITKSGERSDPNVTIAMGREYPIGTEVYIPGYGFRIVQDRGGAIGRNNIDVLVETRAEALANGRYVENVFIKPQ